jgi:TPR repeat protein
MGAQPLKQRIKTFVAGCLLALTLFGIATAGPFEDAAAAYQRGDYATAMRFFRPLSDQGNAAARYNLGLMYAKGQGVPQDYAQAVIWFRKAAEQGHARAQSGLGVMYDAGQGVPQDYMQALIWYRKAAEQEYAIAQYNLGAMYRNGRGVPQDYAQALIWYRKAAAPSRGKPKRRVPLARCTP